MSDTPKELQSAYQRWEMASFGDDRPSVVAKRPAAAVAAGRRTADRGSSSPRCAKQARQAGHDEGHGAGYADGLAIGRAEAAAELEHLQAIALEFGAAIAHADEAIAADVLDLALDLAKACCAPRSR